MEKENNKKSYVKLNKVVSKNRKVKVMDLRFALGVSSSGIFQVPVTVGQGTTNFQRTGDLIRLENMHFNLFAVYGDAVGNPMRIVIFQTVGGFTPTVLTDLFSFGGTGSEDFTSEFLPNLLGRRIHLLYDELLVMNPNGSNGNTVRRGWLQPKVKEYEFAQGTTNVINGQIYVVALTDSAAIPHPGLTLMLRTYFTDA
jgi:hypothetical protein